ncbi:MAG TPA: hypothetical protein VN256_13595 [Pyrinomonadaceae bacterium]|nr:hypothetical protein [Pyrinomonadaceae bacterium]
MGRKLWALCLLILLAVDGARAQSAGLFPGAEAAGDKSSVVLPFDLIDNRIVIDVRLNGKGPFRFIFDSGAGAVVRALGLKIENLQTGGVGEKPVERGETKIAGVDDFREGQAVREARLLRPFGDVVRAGGRPLRGD